MIIDMIEAAMLHAHGEKFDNERSRDYAELFWNLFVKMAVIGQLPIFPKNDNITVELVDGREFDFCPHCIDQDMDYVGSSWQEIADAAYETANAMETSEGTA